MSELGGLRERYVAVWRQILRGWLRWSAERFDDWIARFDADLNDKGNPLFYHEDELYYVVAQLVPRDLGEQLMWVPSRRSYSSLGELLADLDEAIRGRPVMPEWGGPDFDWDAARQRVEAVLRGHGKTLPTHPD